MKNIWLKISLVGSAIIGAIFIIFRFFLVKEPRTEADFPKSAEKLKLEQEIKKTEEELSQVEGKEYTEKEIEEKFNK